jgi:excinuclease UvrABC ATPase subunit
MCPECEGLGRVSAIDVDELVDVERSLNEGAITVPNFGVGTWYWQTLAHSGFVDPDTKLKDYTPQRWEDFLHKPATKISTPMNLNVTYEGLVVKVQRLYLAKDRESGTLSGGEAQRVKMVRHLGSALTDVTYVFDEPTVGLHPHAVQRMNNLLLRMRDKGNTVLVVEHEPEVVEVADQVVDLGPGAGSGKSSLIHGSLEGREGVTWSTSPRSAGRGGATRPPTPGCSTPSGPPSPRPTGSRRPCSAPTPKAPAPTATASASSTRTWP